MPRRRSTSARSPAPLALATALAAGLVACHRPAAPLTHAAYVWQRQWSPAVSLAVETAPPAVGTLRVLAAERSGAARLPVEVGVDAAALVRAGRPVVAVLRIDGTAPLDGVTLAAVAAAADRWRARGVAVTGIEVDHDCPTRRLGDYAAWLRAQRPAARGLPLSITALPAWLDGGPALAALLAASDGVTLQVHAVRAPALFDAAAARGWVERWAATTRRPFTVAIPTYRVRLATGALLEAPAPAVAGFLRGLERAPVPGLAGLAWFRLGNPDDVDAWGARTLAAVIAGAPLRAAIRVALLPAPGGALDVAVENAGNADGPAPAVIALGGAVEDLGGVRGYAAQGGALRVAAPPRLRAGERFVVGWVRGQGVSVAAPR